MRDIFVFLVITITNPLFGQDAETKAMLNEISGKWKKDENNNITFQRIIEVPGLDKSEIYTRALAYFTYNYVKGEDVIQVQDKEAGQIIGKGLFENAFTWQGMLPNHFSIYHILRIDAKDNKARILFSLTEWTEETSGWGIVTDKITNYYPANPDASKNRNKYGKAFYAAFTKAIETMDAMEKAIKDGSISKGIESKDW